MAYAQHIASGKSIAARCAVLTASDTRTESTDKSGQRIRQLLTEAGHTVVNYQIFREDAAAIDAALDAGIQRPDAQLVIITGGTGISVRDITVPSVQARLDTILPGFGELFRMLSFQEIGSGAMLSRAIGGVAKGKLLFALPGSVKAVELAMTRLILPELGHLLSELGK
jgi:molybdopterin adenylyltransferase